MSYIIQELWGYMCHHWSIDIPRENRIATNSISIARQKTFYRPTLHYRVGKLMFLSGVSLSFTVLNVMLSIASLSVDVSYVSVCLESAVT